MTSRARRRGGSRPDPAASRSVLEPNERWGRWLLTLGIAGSALAVGAVHPAVLCVVVVVLLAASVVTWARAEPFRARSSAAWLLWVGIGLTAYTAFQSVPLPAGLLERISPLTADVWSRALTPLHLPGPSFASLSLDPGATRTEVLKGVAYGLAFLTALRLCLRRDGADFCGAAIVVTALVVAAATLLHPAFGAQKVFGIYRPTSGGIEARHIAPILNANALAGYLNIGFVLSLAAALAPRPRFPRPLAVATASVLALVQFWVASRGGVLTMALGAAISIWLARAGRLRRRPTSIGYLLMGAVVAASLAAIVFSTSDDALGELGEKNLTKFQIFGQVLPMIRAFPLWGVGRGAFEQVFPAFHESTSYFVYTHPENVVLQWASEWGLLVTGLTLGALLWALRPSVAAARGHTALGAWAALLTLGVHNLVDFSSELPGLMVALSVCAAMVVGGSRGEAGSRFAAWSERPRLVALACAIAGAGALILVVPRLGSDLYADRDLLHDRALDASTSREAFHQLAAAAMLRHPAEPYLPFAGAVRASRARDESVVPWVAKALERARAYGPAHALLARALFRSSPAQARLEYRLAVEQAHSLAATLVVESLPLIRSYAGAEELLPGDDAAVEVLRQITASTKLASRLPATLARLDEDFVRAAPSDPAPATRRARAALLDLADGDAAPWCASDEAACTAQALEMARRVQGLAPTLCEGFRLEAEIGVRGHDVDGALARLAEATERVTDRRDCATALVRLAEAAGNEARTSLAIDQLLRVGCVDAAECLGTLRSAAAIEQARGNSQRALVIYRRAHQRYPESDGTLVELAGAAAALGLHAEALDAYNHLARRHPEDPRWANAASTERAALHDRPR